MTVDPDPGAAERQDHRTERQADEAPLGLETQIRAEPSRVPLKLWAAGDIVVCPDLAARDMGSAMRAGGQCLPS
jgi:hypothetical protein